MTPDAQKAKSSAMLYPGASLAEILRAGQWRSPAFLAYVDTEALENNVVLEAHLDESSSDDET